MIARDNAATAVGVASFRPSALGGVDAHRGRGILCGAAQRIGHIGAGAGDLSQCERGELAGARTGPGGENVQQAGNRAGADLGQAVGRTARRHAGIDLAAVMRAAIEVGVLIGSGTASAPALAIA